MVADREPNLGSDFNELDGVSVLSSTDVWAVGHADYSSDTLILHWDGTHWSRVTSPNPSLDTNELSGVNAVSPTEAWAAAMPPPSMSTPACASVRERAWTGTPHAGRQYDGVGSHDEAR
jgi:hypothetical protein